MFEAAKPISSKLKRTIENIIEGTEIKRHASKGTLKVTVQNTKLQGNKAGYLSVTAEHREAGERSPSSFGVLHDKIKEFYPDGKYDLAMKYHLSTISPGTKEHGAPMHTQANAEYHAGIGKYSNENAAHLASHLKISHSDAEKLITHLKTIKGEEFQKKALSAHIDSLRPRWSKDMDKIMKEHQLL